MFEYDNMEPGDLVEPETLISPGRELAGMVRSARPVDAAPRVADQAAAAADFGDHGR